MCSTLGQIGRSTKNGTFKEFLIAYFCGVNKFPFFDYRLLKAHIYRFILDSSVVFFLSFIGSYYSRAIYLPYKLISCG